MIGGFMQFFLGVSNTISTYLLGFSVIVFHFIIQIQTFKISKPSTVTIFGIIVLLYISINGIILNNSGILKTNIYLLFAFLPIAAILIIDCFLVNSKRKQLLINFLSLIAFIQLPILLIQKITYELFSNIRLGDKVVHEIDFSFGTFFMADDHALGFFLICFLLYSSKKYSRLKFLIILFLVTASILLTNSKTSYLLLFVTYIYLILMKFKYRKALILLSIPFLALSVYISLKYVDFFEILHLNDAEYFYEAGGASRQQIIFMLLKQGITLFGNGPYSYFNILTGSFEGTENFSQWIWNYFDLGLIGVILFVTYTFIIQYKFGRNNNYSLLITFFLLFFGFFTNYTSDFSMLLTYIAFIRI